MNSLTNNEQQKTSLPSLPAGSYSFFLQFPHLHQSLSFCPTSSPRCQIHVCDYSPRSNTILGILPSTRNTMTVVLGPLRMSQEGVREEDFAREEGEMGQNQIIICSMSFSSYICPYKLSVIKFYNLSTLT